MNIDWNADDLNAKVSVLDYEMRRNRQDIDSLAINIHQLENQPSTSLIRDDMQYLHKTVMGLLQQVSDLEKRLSQTEQQVGTFAVSQLL